MKLAVMQPYFYPYLGHFDLLNQVDLWIVFDVVQYINRGWMNRNRILDRISGWQYIIMPTKKHHQKTLIHQIEIAQNINWQEKILHQLSRYSKESPYYLETIKFMQDSLLWEEGNLSRFNIFVLRKTCEKLGIQTPLELWSETKIPFQGENAEEAIIKLCKALGANEYVNPPGGTNLYSFSAFAQHNIKLTFQSYAPMNYSCGKFEFIPNLSIIDVMMWNSPEEIKRYLDASRLQQQEENLV